MYWSLAKHNEKFPAMQANSMLLLEHLNYVRKFVSVNN